MRLKGWAILAAFAVAGCTNALPSQGPSAVAITDQENPAAPKAPYIVVELDEKTTNITGQFKPPAFASVFKLRGPVPDLVLAKGDKLDVNIFEAGADGLFSSATSKASQISTVIDGQGRIFVPYVGAVQAAGRSVNGLRSAIEASLQDKAIQPQVQVLVTESRVNSVTVLGTVGTPGLVPLTFGGIRLLDVIAAAGGSSTPTYETQVVLRRGHRVATAHLEDIFDKPKENVIIQPGDTILVSQVARTYTVFGAFRNKQEVPFATRRVTLAEAMARVGGLVDTEANARGVFIFRFEPDHIAKQLNPRATTAPEGTRVPTIYRINLKDPKSFFLMQLFDMRDEDVVYVANHPAAELGKFLQILSPVLSNANLVTRTTNTFAE
ncbi:MAG: polysaccharide biosynthesis/export family protein [Devosia sp.]